MNYEKLRQDLLKKVGTSKIMSLILTKNSPNEKELLRLAKKYNLNISEYQFLNYNGGFVRTFIVHVMEFIEKIKGKDRW